MRTRGMFDTGAEPAFHWPEVTREEVLKRCSSLGIDPGKFREEDLPPAKVEEHPSASPPDFMREPKKFRDDQTVPSVCVDRCPDCGASIVDHYKYRCRSCERELPTIAVHKVRKVWRDREGFEVKR